MDIIIRIKLPLKHIRKKAVFERMVEEDNRISWERVPSRYLTWKVNESYSDDLHNLLWNAGILKCKIFHKTIP